MTDLEGEVISPRENHLRVAYSLAASPHTWPGGHERFAVMSDGAHVCTDCVRNDSTSIINAQPGDDWFIVDSDHCGARDTPTECTHCGKQICCY